MPTVELPAAIPPTAQVTPVLDVPVTCAVNWIVCPTPTDGVAGVIAMFAGATNVTSAVADPPEPVAVIVTEVDEGMVEGAVYRPVEEMDPTVADQLVAPDA